MKRTDDDTWDMASSVGATATMVAAARALASREDNPLIDDPFAEPLVRAVGIDFFTKFVAGDIDLAAVDDGGSARMLTDVIAVRTRFFDDFFMGATEAGVRQAVILAAGLDSRAYRLPWPAGTVVFEIDQPKVLEYKAATLADHDVKPAATLHQVPVDLRNDWAAALRDNGFDPSQPTAWLAEGLLMYLPADAQDTLFTLITELSAPGSRIAAEAVGVRSDERRAQMQERFEKIANELGIEREIDVAELMYNDPDRADVAEWLTAHGWRAQSVTSQDAMRRHGRHVELADAEDDAFATFATGVKL